MTGGDLDEAFHPFAVNGVAAAVGRTKSDRYPNHAPIKFGQRDAHCGIERIQTPWRVAPFGLGHLAGDGLNHRHIKRERERVFEVLLGAVERKGGGLNHRIDAGRAVLREPCPCERLPIGIELAQ